MIGIIGAMEEEVGILKDKIVDLSEISVAHVNSILVHLIIKTLF